MARWLATGTAGCVVLMSTACARHTVDVQPIRVEPIHMTIDVNVRVDRELDEFFDFKNEQVIVVPPATQPATLPATQTPQPDPASGGGAP